MEIRIATENDIEELTSLIEQLGYPTSKEQMKIRFHRSKGIGNKLLKAAEDWARKMGATGIGLNSGHRPERMKAHQFYKKMGYVEKSIGFVKSIV